MSYTETHIGKLRKINIDSNLTFAESVSKLTEMGYKLTSDLEVDPKSTYVDSEQIVYIQPLHEFYEFVKHIDVEEGDNVNICKMKKNGDFEFVFQFYNGGTCLNEMIEEGILKERSKVEKKNK